MIRGTVGCHFGHLFNPMRTIAPRFFGIADAVAAGKAGKRQSRKDRAA